MNKRNFGKEYLLTGLAWCLPTFKTCTECVEYARKCLEVGMLQNTEFEVWNLSWTGLYLRCGKVGKNELDTRIKELLKQEENEKQGNLENCSEST